MNMIISLEIMIHFSLFFLSFRNRFEENESQSELDEEVQLPKKARIIRANIIGKIDEVEVDEVFPIIK